MLLTKIKSNAVINEKGKVKLKRQTYYKTNLSFDKSPHFN